MNSTAPLFASLLWCFLAMCGCSATEPQPVDNRVRIVYILDNIGSYDTISCGHLAYPTDRDPYVPLVAYITKNGDSAVFVDSNLASVRAQVFAIRISPAALDWPIDTLITNIRSGHSYYVRYDATK
jgi:Zn-dependent M28 family amino/carboxypeptidase